MNEIHKYKTSALRAECNAALNFELKLKPELLPMLEELQSQIKKNFIKKIDDTIAEGSYRWKLAEKWGLQIKKLMMQ